MSASPRCRHAAVKSISRPTSRRKKKNDTENVKILKPTNKVEEDVHSADYSYNPHTRRRFRAHVVSFKNSRHGAQLQRVESEPKNKNKTEPMVKPEN